MIGGSVESDINLRKSSASAVGNSATTSIPTENRCYPPPRRYGARSLFQELTMADAAHKYPENIQGKYYVDDQCIDCDLCRETAPANFTRNDDGGHSYVHKQPETPEEEALSKEAMKGCPGEAIGSDG